MGNKKLTRRNFFRSLRETTAGVVSDGVTDTIDDPLFEKYSRKKLTPRHYSQEEVVHQLGTAGDAAREDLRVGNVTSGLAEYTGALTESDILHLVRRTNFGWKKTFVDTLLGVAAANSGAQASAVVDAVLNIDMTPPAPPVNWYQNTFADEAGLAYGADWTTSLFAGSVGQTSNHYRMDAMRRWLFGLTLNGDQTIREKMVWFWFHFIPIDFESIYQSSNSYVATNCARIFYTYFKMFRDNATGNFKNLITQVAKHPAMMYYLNNQANSAAAPDENFARELMELFTLGKDPASQYTQNDVIAAAKVLTGWRVQNLNLATMAVSFVSTSHSQTAKQFSSFFNNTLISNQAGAAGANELDLLINMIFAKDTVVSQYICRRLYRYFVYYDIDANIEANVIVPLAQTFVSSGWNILPVLKQLFKSQHFFDMANRGVYIKSPFDLAAGFVNMFNLDTVGSTIENQYKIWSYFNDSVCLSMEQQMGSIPNVSGWNAYYQTPAYHQYWINSNAVQKRYSFIQTMFSTNGTTQGGKALKADTVAFIQQFGPVISADPDLLVATAIKYLIPIDLSQPQKDQLKVSTLLTGQITNSYWTTAWNTYIGNPTTANRNIVETRLRNLFTGICQLAEYQLM